MLGGVQSVWRGCSCTSVLSLSSQDLFETLMSPLYRIEFSLCFYLDFISKRHAGLEIFCCETNFYEGLVKLKCSHIWEPDSDHLLSNSGSKYSATDVSIFLNLSRNMVTFQHLLCQVQKEAGWHLLISLNHDLARCLYQTRRWTQIPICDNFFYSSLTFQSDTWLYRNIFIW